MPRLFKEDKENKVKNERIFGTLLCMKRIYTNKNTWFEFVEELDNLMNKYPMVKKETMGFPENWKYYLVGNPLY